MSVCGFGIESGSETVVLLLDCHVEEVGLLMGEIGRELDGPVKRIDMCNE